MAENVDWRNKAACRDEDPELFFPLNTNTKQGAEQIKEAKAVCNRCEVIGECLLWAMENSQDSGVWGGMSEDERKTLRKRRAKGLGGKTTRTIYNRDDDF